MADIKDNDRNDILSDNTVLSNNDLNSNNKTSTSNKTTTNNTTDNTNNSRTDNSDYLGIEDVLNDNVVGTANNSDNSFQDYSDNSTNDDSDHSTEVEVEVEFEDSFNDNSDNRSDSSHNDSHNNDESIRNQDSFNITSSFNTQTLNDNSTTVGVRQYNTGFGDINAGGLFGGGGGKGGASDLDLKIDNRALNFDQSVNQAISTSDNGHGGGNVSQDFSQSANVAFGDDSIAAGGNVNITNTDFNLKIGDVNVGNTNLETRIDDSFNDFSKNFDLEYEFEADGSFNETSNRTDVEVEIEDSFTSEIDNTFKNSLDWENNGNIFSPGAAADDSRAETEFDF